jgi:arginase
LGSTDYAHDNGLSLEELRTAFAAFAVGDVIGLEIAEFQNAWTDGGEPVSPDALLQAVQPVISRLQRMQ